MINNYINKIARWLAAKNKKLTYKQIVIQRTILLLLLFMIEVGLILLFNDVWQPEFWLSCLLLIVIFCMISSIYHASFSYMLLDDVNIRVYQDYLASTKLIQGLNKNTKFIYEVAQVDLDYIQGKFQQAEERLSKIVLPEKLTKRTEGFALNVYKFRLLLDMQQGREVDLEQSLEKISQFSVSNEEILLGIKAVCDLLFAKVPNDFYEDKSSDYYLHQLQYDYYRAINAELKGETAKARDIYQELTKENSQLYAVQQAKEKLKQI